MLALGLAAAIATCPIERADYVLRGHRDVTARFHPAPVNDDWRNGIALALRFAKTKRTY